MKYYWIAGLVLAWPAVALAQTTVRFSQDVKPILSSRCFKCHGPDFKKAGLDLQGRETALRVLKSGNRAIVPGKSGESTLLERVSATEETERMPPKGEPLTPAQISTLKAWIDQGAAWEEHWSYVKPARRPLPATRNPRWQRTGIDAFVLARLEQEGLEPAAEADRATLLRRLALDLTGLPPTPAEVDAFVVDPRPEAYERQVDRLLASPHYGERQARLWLDLARYADTNGYEKDDRRTIWPYRDWVIQAYNRDLPFDRFTIEQIAGDLLPGATTDQLVATGFHRNTMTNTEGGTDDEEFRVAALVDRVNTTMEVWMGTTIACAQCHNHKYDPFSQTDFYKLLAFYNSTADPGRSTEPHLALPTPAQAARLQALRAEMARPPGLPLAGQPLQTVVLLKVEQEHLARLKRAETAVNPTSTLIMKELPTPRATHVHVRGNHQRPGDKVAPGVPAKLHQPAPGPAANRLTLAQWLVAPDNPLVGRVMLNRIWSQYFGRGFVDTSEDFGAQGEPPSHPELLDWLATEWPRQGWSMKAMHRLIVLSAVYRQASRIAPEAYQRDPYNRLLARGPRFRMEAEMVRDNALAIGGQLSHKIGGPSVFPHQPEGVWNNPYSGDKWTLSKDGDQFRRGLYTFWRRTAPYAAFMAFDAPSREVSCDRRPRSNTPLQALATLNDPAFVEPAAALGRRMLAEGGPTDTDRVVHGFRLCVSRMPTDVEIGHLLELYRANLTRYRADPDAAQRLARLASGAASDPAALAAWTVVANVLMNLDETITRS